MSKKPVTKKSATKKTAAKKAAARKSVVKKSAAGKAAAPRQARRGDDLISRMERMFDDFSRQWRLPLFSRDWGRFEPFDISMPSLKLGSPIADVKFDVSESDDAIKISAELPGLNEDDFEVTLQENLLTISGEKSQESEDKSEDHHIRERHFGSFKRSFRVPPSVDTGKIDADFNKGVLKITLPKSPSAKAAPRKVQVGKK